MNKNKSVVKFYFDTFGERRGKLFYPRRIQPTESHPNPVLFAMAAATAHTAIANGADDMGHYGSDTNRATWGVLVQGVRYKWPTYFVSEDFIRSVAATKPPPDMTFEHLNWPMDSMLFVLPRKFMREYVGWCVEFIALAHLHPGENRSEVGFAESKNHMLLIHYPLVLKNGVTTSYAMWSPVTESIKTLANVEHLQIDTPLKIKEIIEDWEVMVGTAPRPEGRAEEEMNQKVTSLGIKLLLAMNSIPPEQIEEAVCVRPQTVKRGVVVKEELWHPNFLGRTYKSKTEWMGGTHASPRMHWRAGHYRNQPHGTGRQLRKLIWIEPVMIMGDAETKE